MVTYVLPVYLTVVIPLLILCFLIGIHCILGVFTTSKDILIVKWTILRWLTEGLSIFLLHPGIGVLSFRRSAAISFLWSLANGAAMVGALYIGGFKTMLYTSVVILVELIAYYLLMIGLPVKVLHRRPAMRRYSILNALILLYQLSVVLSYVGTDANSSSLTACVVEVSFSITEFLQICAIMYAFCLDSQFWQGLYVGQEDNLNEPLRGIWDMNRQEVNLVAQSVIQLERKVVPIIPFSQLRVDTSKYFSGGTARVYRGTFQTHDVAIKFLFCMELTPDRIVDFCHEATMLNSLQHTNIVTCYGVAIMPPAISLVTEYCTWGSLFDFLHATDLVCDFPEDDEEEDGEEELEGEETILREDGEEEEEPRRQQSGHPSSGYIGNRSRLSTTDTKDSQSSRKPSNTSRSGHYIRSSYHQSKPKSKGYFTQLWHSLFSHPDHHHTREAGKASQENAISYHSQDVRNPMRSEEPSSAISAGVGADIESASSQDSGALYTSYLLPRRQTMSVDRALDEQQKYQQQMLQQQQQRWSLARYLDPDEHGDDADPNDVATKLANAMAASMESRRFTPIPSKRFNKGTSQAAKEGPARSRNTSTSNGGVASMSVSSTSAAIRRPRFSSSSSTSTPQVTMNGVSSVSGSVNMSATAADRATPTGPAVADIESNQRPVEDSKGDEEEPSWHSLSISRSLLSKHHINAAVFLTPLPSTETPAGGGTGTTGGVKARPHTTGRPSQQNRLHHSHHHVRSLHLSGALHQASLHRTGHKLRPGGKPLRSSSSWRLSDSGGATRGSDSYSGGGHSRNDKLKWKSPAAVMLTAEMGFGMGPRSSNSQASSSLNNSASVATGAQNSYHLSFSHSKIKNRHRSQSAAKFLQPPAATTTATSTNTPSMSGWGRGWSPFRYFFTGSTNHPPQPPTESPTMSYSNRRRLNTATSVLSTVSSAPSVDEAQTRKYELKTALLPEGHTAGREREEEILAQLSSAAIAQQQSSTASHHHRPLSKTDPPPLSHKIGLTSMSLHSSVQSLGHLIPASVRFQMMRDCAAGLAYLHSRGFMHCDIKSLNFLVTQQLVVKLADLGEARQVAPPKPLPRPSMVSSPFRFKSTSSPSPPPVVQELSNVVMAATEGADGAEEGEDDFEYEDVPEHRASSMVPSFTSPFDDGGEEEEESLPSNINWSSPETLQRSLMRHETFVQHQSQAPSAANSRQHIADLTAGMANAGNASATATADHGGPSRKRRIVVNERADVWSLAMVMYEIVSGEVPFDTDECRAMSFDQFLSRVKNGLRPQIPAEYHKYPWLLELVRSDAFSIDKRVRLDVCELCVYVCRLTAPGHSTRRSDVPPPIFATC